MAFQTPPYQLFNVRPPSSQRRMNAFVSALWRRLYPRSFFGPNCCLDQVFAQMSHQPERAALKLCPYYFDQVTYSLPTREQVRNMWVPLLSFSARWVVWPSFLSPSNCLVMSPCDKIFLQSFIQPYGV